MRIAGTSFNDTLVNQLNSLASRQYLLQNQVSTGQRIQAPGDDPTGMGQALSLQTQGSYLTQYSQNISTLQTRANVAYNALQQLKTISDRAGEIATQADGTATPAAMQTFADQIDQLIKDAVQQGNAQDGNQYIFAGTSSDKPAFVTTTDSNGNITAVTYQGNTTVNSVDIAQGSAISVDTPGANTTGAGPRGLLSDSRYGADFFNHLISLAKDLRSGNASAISSNDLPALKKDEDNLIYHIANNGVVQGRLDSASSVGSAQQTSLQKEFTNVTGVDLTQTIVQLTQTQNTYQAALQSSSALIQMQQMLFKYF